MSRFTKILTVLLLVSTSLAACAAPLQNTSAAAELPEESQAAPATEIPVEASAEAEVEEEAEAAPPEAAPAEPAETNTETTPAENLPLTGGITIYISPDSLGYALEEAFEAEHGDVITIVGGSWCRKVKSEQEAGDIQADVLYGAEPIFYSELAESGALLAYTPEQAANLKTEYQWDTPYYTIADLRYVGIVYNRTMINPEDLPTDFAGLNETKWENLTAVPDATQCASAFAIAAAITQPDLDTSFLQAAKDNGALLADRAGKLPELVASGEAALGIGPHDPVVRLQNKAKSEGVESPVAIAWAEEGAYVMPRPIAITADENRSAENTALAQAFVDFVLSPEGQTLAVKKRWICTGS